MAQELAPHTAMPFGDMERLAAAVAKSRLFGIQTPEQALVLMFISQAEGRHPAMAARDYDIIQGRPAKKSQAMLRDFLAAGGKVEWHALDDAKAEATFSHPQGGSVRIMWDMKRADQAGLKGKEMYRKFPRQMLRARAVSEGVQTVCPIATSGFYTPEEVADFKDVTPVPAAAPQESVKADLDAFAEVDLAEPTARKGSAALRDWWEQIGKVNRQRLADRLPELKKLAEEADRDDALFQVGYQPD